MTVYQNPTDPSYNEQILVMTYPSRQQRVKHERRRIAGILLEGFIDRIPVPFRATSDEEDPGGLLEEHHGSSWRVSTQGLDEELRTRGAMMGVLANRRGPYR
jgi:carbamoylphosphate synthase small subunit